MGTTVYEPCTYKGGFEGMRPSEKSVLELSDTQFSLRRPRVLFKRSLLRIWANWSAVTGLTVTDSDAGAVLALATKARGRGEVVLPGTDAEAVWEVLDQLADLEERFHHPPETDETGETGEVEDGAEAADAADEADQPMEADEVEAGTAADPGDPAPE